MRLGRPLFGAVLAAGVALTAAAQEDDAAARLQARLDTARARAAAARAVLSGEEPPSAALPALMDALGSPPRLAARLVELDERSRSRADERATVTAGEPAGALHAAALDAEREADDLERQVLYAAVARLGKDPASAATIPGDTERESAAEGERAREKVAQAVAQRARNLSQKTSDAVNTADIRRGANEDLVTELEGRRGGFEERITESRKALRNLTATSPVQLVDLLTGDEDDASHLYRRLRTLLKELRDEVHAGSRAVLQAGAHRTEEHDAVEAEREEIEGFRPFVDSGEIVETESLQEARANLESWSRAVDDRQGLARSYLRTVEEHRELVLVQLNKANDLRRACARRISGEELRENLIEDLGSELRLIRPSLEVRARHRLRTLTETPSLWLRDWGAASAALVAVFKLVALALLWWWSRRYAPRTVPPFLNLWAERAERYDAGDLRGMEAPGRRATVALVDLVAVAVALGIVGSGLPELGLVLRLYLTVVAYRLLLGLAELAVAGHPEIRPALVTLPPAARNMALTTVRYGTLWLVAGYLVRFVALEILAAVTLGEVLRLLFQAVLAVLVVWGLHAWEPHLRGAVRRREPANPFTRWLAREHAGILRPLLGLLCVVLLAVFAVRELLGARGQWAVEQVLAYLRRRPDAVGDSGTKIELPGEVQKHLALRECSDEWYVKRPEVEARLDEPLRRFLDEDRGDTLLVVGEEGSGKHTLVERWCRAREEDGRAVVRLRLAERLTTRAEAVRWLAEAFEIDEPPETPETLAGRLGEKVSDRIVLVEDFHFAFLRRVDGFAAIRFLLAVIASVQAPAFWLVTMYRPAWCYLSSLGGLVNTEIFRQVVELAPFEEDALRRLVVPRTTAEHQLSFAPLLGTGVTGWPALERVSNEFFRRLRWASTGNPAVALALWRERLSPTPDAARLAVTGFVRKETLPELRDGELFLLAAIYTHRSLTEDELVEVLNMRPSLVRSAVRNLESRRLLVTRSKRFSLAPRHLVTVTRDLRLRHIVHGNA